ncbi:MAG: prepilin peptidase [bacterium]|nr:prepilin peptidase [bacterium]
MVIPYIVFVLGLFIGSFLNVCIYRWPLDKSVVRPRSACTNCSAVLAPVDLIPVLSYLAGGRKCRYCKSAISPRYALVEILTGLTFVALYLSKGLTVDLLGYTILFSLLIIAFFVDLDHQIIPDQVSLGGIVIGVLFDVALLCAGYARPTVDLPLLANGISVPGSIFGAVLCFAVFYVIAVAASAVFKAEALGGGDIKLAGAIGAFLGWKLALLSFVLAFVAGAAGGIILLASKLKTRRDYIPFGPYMVIGAVTAVFIGASILTWYFGLYF